MSTPTPAPDPTTPVTPEVPTVNSPEAPTYLRHRDRMIRESVFEDLQNTLIACQWMPGTTTRAVRNVNTGVREVVTTAPTQVLAMLNYPIQLIEFFPEANETQQGKVPTNTLAMDVGRRGDSVALELGSSSMVTEHSFNFAFYAEDDGLALAIFNDLRDRYNGNIVEGDGVNLYNFLADPPRLVSRMEVDLFRYARDAESISPAEVHLYFAELTITDVE